MRRALLLVLLLSALVPSLPRFADDVRLAGRLRHRSWEGRREALMPGFYQNIEELRKQIPPGETIAAITESRQEIDDAIFINYYLFPRHVRIFGSRWEYLSAKGQPRLIVRPGDARLVRYADIRNQDVQRARIVRSIVLPADTRARFIIPIVTSADGMPPAAYTVEGALAADSEAHVRLTLWPAGIVRVFSLRGTRTFHDLVFECFGRMEFAAWVEVESDRPLHAAFWFVNRTVRSAAPIHLADGPLRAAVPFPALPHPALVWLLNPGNTPVVAHSGSHPALVRPHELMAIWATGAVSGPVYAFISQKMPDGSTRFLWPEDVR